MSLSRSHAQELVLYIDLMSQPCRAVMIFCRLAGIPFTPRFVSLRRKEHLALTANPTRQLPFVEDGDFVLSESHAILTYLCTTRNCADHWYPRDPQLRATCNQFLHWHHSNLRSIERYLHYWFKERTEGSVPAGLLEHYQRDMHSAMERLNRWLQGKTFVLGERMCIYDLSAVCEVAELMLVPGMLRTTLEKYAELKRWFQQVYRISEVKDAHSVIEKIAQRYDPDCAKL